jgi:hypothetical protein
MDRHGLRPGPHEDFYTVLNSAGRPEILRGHRLTQDGFYLGRLRESFPGTDGLSRSTVIAGEAWLRDPEAWHPSFLIGEGATFATRGFLDELHRSTHMLLIHLVASSEVVSERFAQRGSNQDPTFVKATVTRSLNTAERLAGAGTRVLTVDTGDDPAVDIALDICSWHLGLRT